MRGIIRRWNQCVAVVGALALLLASSYVPRTSAASPLALFSDTISTSLPGAQNVFHDVSFILPLTSQQIVASDWVIIDFPAFTNVTAPSYVTGNFGVPSSSLQGTTVRLSGLTILPGSEVHIVGITATNPPLQNEFTVGIKIASDAAATRVRNVDSTEASQGGNVVSVSATVDSPLSSLVISGSTSPGAFTTLTENSVVLATQAADGLGGFLFTLGGLDPGNHSFRINSSDSQNRTTSQSTLQIYLAGATLTRSSGILLSPTISLDKTTIKPGDALTISGSSLPSANVSIFTESPLRSYTATSDANGNWSHTLSSAETTQYVPGQYRAYADVQDNFGNTSIVSNNLNFQVGSPVDASNPPPACNISHGDLNCDGKTNLTDFSILIFHWRTNHKLADINGDGAVNLVDFSIMMFYFKR